MGRATSPRACSAQGGAFSSRALLTDITERKASEDRSCSLADHDALTDLLNRRRSGGGGGGGGVVEAVVDAT